MEKLYDQNSNSNRNGSFAVTLKINNFGYKKGLKFSNKAAFRVQNSSDLSISAFTGKFGDNQLTTDNNTYDKNRISKVFVDSTVRSKKRKNRKKKKGRNNSFIYNKNSANSFQPGTFIAGSSSYFGNNSNKSFGEVKNIEDASENNVNYKSKKKRKKSDIGNYNVKKFKHNTGHESCIHSVSDDSDLNVSEKKQDTDLFYFDIGGNRSDELLEFPASKDVQDRLNFKKHHKYNKSLEQNENVHILRKHREKNKEIFRKKNSNYSNGVSVSESYVLDTDSSFGYKASKIENKCDESITNLNICDKDNDLNNISALAECKKNKKKKIKIVNEKRSSEGVEQRYPTIDISDCDSSSCSKLKKSKLESFTHSSEFFEKRKKNRISGTDNQPHSFNLEHFVGDKKKNLNVPVYDQNHILIDTCFEHLETEKSGILDGKEVQEENVFYKKKKKQRNQNKSFQYINLKDCDDDNSDSRLSSKKSNKKNNIKNGSEALVKNERYDISDRINNKELMFKMPSKTKKKNKDKAVDSLSVSESECEIVDLDSSCSRRKKKHTGDNVVLGINNTLTLKKKHKKKTQKERETVESGIQKDSLDSNAGHSLNSITYLKYYDCDANTRFSKQELRKSNVENCVQKKSDLNASSEMKICNISENEELMSKVSKRTKKKNKNKYGDISINIHESECEIIDFEDNTFSKKKEKKKYINNNVDLHADNTSKTKWNTKTLENEIQKNIYDNDNRNHENSINSQPVNEFKESTDQCKFSKAKKKKHKAQVENGILDCITKQEIVKEVDLHHNNYKDPDNDEGLQKKQSAVNLLDQNSFSTKNRIYVTKDSAHVSDSILHDQLSDDSEIISPVFKTKKRGEFLSKIEPVTALVKNETYDISDRINNKELMFKMPSKVKKKNKNKDVDSLISVSESECEIVDLDSSCSRRKKHACDNVVLGTNNTLKKKHKKKTQKERETVENGIQKDILDSNTGHSLNNNCDVTTRFSKQELRKTNVENCVQKKSYLNSSSEMKICNISENEELMSKVSERRKKKNKNKYGDISINIHESECEIIDFEDNTFSQKKEKKKYINNNVDLHADNTSKTKWNTKTLENEIQKNIYDNDNRNHENSINSQPVNEFKESTDQCKFSKAKKKKHKAQVENGILDCTTKQEIVKEVDLHHNNSRDPDNDEGLQREQSAVNLLGQNSFSNKNRIYVTKDTAHVSDSIFHDQLSDDSEIIRPVFKTKKHGGFLSKIESVTDEPDNINQTKQEREVVDSILYDTKKDTKLYEDICSLEEKEHTNNEIADHGKKSEIFYMSSNIFRRKKERTTKDIEVFQDQERHNEENTDDEIKTSICNKSIVIDDTNMCVKEEFSPVSVSSNSKKQRKHFATDATNSNENKNEIRKMPVFSEHLQSLGDAKSECNSNKFPTLEVSADSEENEEDCDKLRSLFVILPFSIPPMHAILTRSSIPTKEQLEKIKNLNIPIKNGPFSKEEDDKIIENWKEFCKEHDLRMNPAPFVKFPRRMRVETKTSILRYLAHGLDNRPLHRVYIRFRHLLKKTKLKTGRFTSEEDKTLLNFMENTISKKPFKDLALLLGRTSLSVEKRYDRLKDTNNKTKFFTLQMVNRFVRELMRIAKCEKLKKLRHREFTIKEWRKLSKKLDDIPITKLQRAWNVTIYPHLFSKEVDMRKIKREIINMLYERNETDWRTVNWKDIAKNFKGFTAQKIYMMAKQFASFHVPKEMQNDLRECLEFSRNKILKYDLIPTTHKFKKFVLKNGHIAYEDSDTN